MIIMLLKRRIIKGVKTLKTLKLNDRILKKQSKNNLPEKLSNFTGERS